MGEGEPRSIVCGAWNFGAGATVAVALPGAVLPNGLTLERRKVRGEVSDGMILAEDELDLGADHTGIMLLPEDAEPGTPLADVLPLARRRARVESTGNRPDLLSVYGIAREVAALYDLPLAPQPGLGPSSCPDDEPVDDPDRGPRAGCPRYIGAAVRGRRDRALAGLAEGAAARRRDAPDLERRRRDELRDARARQPAARVRLHDARAAAGSSCAARGRASACARSTASTATLDARRPDDRRRRAVGRARRDHGRRGDGDRRGTTTVLLEAANFEPYGIYRRASGCGCAPRGRTAGRRASTRTSPSPPRTSRRRCSSSSRARAGPRTPTSTTSCRSGR